MRDCERKIGDKVAVHHRMLLTARKFLHALDEIVIEPVDRNSAIGVTLGLAFADRFDQRFGERSVPVGLILRASSDPVEAA